VEADQVHEMQQVLLFITVDKVAQVVRWMAITAAEQVVQRYKISNLMDQTAAQVF
jgi:hypothetical protein